MKIFKIILLLSLFIFTSAVLTGAEEKWRYKIIKTDEMKKLIDSKGDYLLVDALSPLQYEIDHIPTAINIPMGKLKAKVKALGEDKNKKIIFYCLGPKCIFSKHNAEDAIDLGYKNIYVYEEGSPEWQKRGFPMEKGKVELPKITPASIEPEALEKIKDKVVIIDVINQAKEVGKIEGAKVVHINDFLEKYSQIPKDKDVVIYDLHSKQDKLAIKFLVSKGYDESKLKYLNGGIMAWIKAGKKVVKS